MEFRTTTVNKLFLKNWIEKRMFWIDLRWVLVKMNLTHISKKVENQIRSVIIEAISKVEEIKSQALQIWDILKF